MSGRICLVAWSLVIPVIAVATPGPPPVGYTLSRVSDAVPGESVSNITQLAFRPGDAQHLFAVRATGFVTRYDVDPATGELSNAVDVASALPFPLGIAFRGDELYVSLNPGNDSRIARLRDLDLDGLYEERSDFVRGVPNRDHGIDQLQIVGSTLYAPIGTRWNSGNPTCEGTVYTGTLARIADLDLVDHAGGANHLPSQAVFLDPAPADGLLRRYAFGFRNPFGLRVDPDGNVWASDNGASFCNTCSSCSNFPLDTPDYIYSDVPVGAKGQFPPAGQPGGGGATLSPLATLATHAAATGFDWIATGPDAGRVVLAQFGSSEGYTPAGRNLALVDPAAGTVSELVPGFLGPTDVKADLLGRLYVADYVEPAIYLLVPPGIGAVGNAPTPVGAARLEAVAPNPVRSTLRVEYTLGEAGPVTWSIRDVAGREVARAHDGVRPAGRHTRVLSLDRGKALAPGVYFLRIETPAGGASRRFAIVK